MKVTVLLLASLLLARTGLPAQELGPGIVKAGNVSDLPIPLSGVQVYLLGEVHGAQENEELLAQLVSRLGMDVGLRDVAIEEDGTYEFAARRYVEHRSAELPPELCLRRGIFDTLRQLNQGRAGDALFRVHLVDIDSPANAIRAHLLAIQADIPGSREIRVPAASGIRNDGLAAVGALRRLATDDVVLGQLRTIDHSIRALQQGLQVGVGPPSGSPYLEDREQAIASNMHDLVRSGRDRPVLAFYGIDHVAKRLRHDGGPNRDTDFAPLAMRLTHAGLRVFSIAAFPLSGATRWRGREQDLPWSASDGSLASGETLDRLLAAAAGARYLYVDSSRQTINLPSQDVSRSGVDAFVLFPRATPLKDGCFPR
ncbi:MAG: hypothetical protein ABI051_07230 [Vicinamibacterales bacterium]